MTKLSRFNRDNRIFEVEKLLTFTKPIVISLDDCSSIAADDEVEDSVNETRQAWLKEIGLNRTSTIPIGLCGFNFASTSNFSQLSNQIFSSQKKLILSGHFVSPAEASGFNINIDIETSSNGNTNNASAGGGTTNSTNPNISSSISLVSITRTPEFDHGVSIALSLCNDDCLKSRIPAWLIESQVTPEVYVDYRNNNCEVGAIHHHPQVSQRVNLTGPHNPQLELDFSSCFHRFNGLVLGFGLNGLLQKVKGEDLVKLLDVHKSFYNAPAFINSSSHVSLLMESTCIAVLLGVSASCALREGQTSTFQQDRVFGVSNDDAFDSLNSQSVGLKWAVSRACLLHAPGMSPSEFTNPYLSAGFLTPAVQCAAILGLGLCYVSSFNFQLNEMLLSQAKTTCCIKLQTADPVLCSSAANPTTALANGFLTSKSQQQPPATSDDDVVYSNCMTFCAQEEYVLTIGFSLGLNNLCSPCINEELINYIGGFKPIVDTPITIYNRKSLLVDFETNRINYNLSEPMSLAALTLASLKLSSATILEHVCIPQNLYQLGLTRPDFLLLRISCINLTCNYKNVEPTLPFIRSQIPNFLSSLIAYEKTNSCTELRNLIKLSNADKLPSYLLEYDRSLNQSKSSAPNPVDWLLVQESFLSIVSASCWAIGLKFASTCNMDARDLLCKILLVFTDMFAKRGNIILNVSGVVTYKTGKKNNNSTVDRGTLVQCTSQIVLALGLVMCNSGNLKSLRILRNLRLCLLVDTKW